MLDDIFDLVVGLVVFLAAAGVLFILGCLSILVGGLFGVGPLYSIIGLILIIVLIFAAKDVGEDLRS